MFVAGAQQGKAQERDDWNKLCDFSPLPHVECELGDMRVCSVMLEQVH